MKVTEHASKRKNDAKSKNNKVTKDRLNHNSTNEKDEGKRLGICTRGISKQHKTRRKASTKRENRTTEKETKVSTISENGAHEINAKNKNDTSKDKALNEATKGIGGVTGRRKKHADVKKDEEVLVTKLKTDDSDKTEDIGEMIKSDKGEDKGKTKGRCIGTGIGGSARKGKSKSKDRGTHDQDSEKLITRSKSSPLQKWKSSKENETAESEKYKRGKSLESKVSNVNSKRITKKQKESAISVKEQPPSKRRRTSSAKTNKYKNKKRDENKEEEENINESEENRNNRSMSKKKNRKLNDKEDNFISKKRVKISNKNEEEEDDLSKNKKTSKKGENNNTSRFEDKKMKDSKDKKEQIKKKTSLSKYAKVEKEKRKGKEKEKEERREKQKGKEKEEEKVMEREKEKKKVKVKEKGKKRETKKENEKKREEENVKKMERAKKKGKGKGKEKDNDKEKDKDKEKELDGERNIKMETVNRQNVKMTFEVTNRFAVLGCDWDNISSIDVFYLFESYYNFEKEKKKKFDYSKSRAVKRVTIYTSKYGEKKLKYEEEHGPVFDFGYLQRRKNRDAIYRENNFYDLINAEKEAEKEAEKGQEADKKKIKTGKIKKGKSSNKSSEESGSDVKDEEEEESEEEETENDDEDKVEKVKDDTEEEEEEKDDDEEDQDEEEILRDNINKGVLQLYKGVSDEEENERIRLYQLQRSRYYFALVECYNKEIVEFLYEELNDMDADFCVNYLDLRIMDDNCSLDDYKVKEVCEKIPLNYKFYYSVSSALKHSNVKSNWDENPRRKRFLSTRFTEEELRELDMKEYLAETESDEDAEENDITEEQMWNEKKQQREKHAERYRNLLLGDFLDDEKNVDIEKYLHRVETNMTNEMTPLVSVDSKDRRIKGKSVSFNFNEMNEPFDSRKGSTIMDTREQWDRSRADSMRKKHKMKSEDEFHFDFEEKDIKVNEEEEEEEEVDGEEDDAVLIERSEDYEMDEEDDAVLMERGGNYEMEKEEEEEEEDVGEEEEEEDVGEEEEEEEEDVGEEEEEEDVGEEEEEEEEEEEDVREEDDAVLIDSNRDYSLMDENEEEEEEEEEDTVVMEKEADSEDETDEEERDDTFVTGEEKESEDENENDEEEEENEDAEDENENEEDENENDEDEVEDIEDENENEKDETEEDKEEMKEDEDEDEDEDEENEQEEENKENIEDEEEEEEEGGVAKVFKKFLSTNEKREDSKSPWENFLEKSKQKKKMRRKAYLELKKKRDEEIKNIIRTKPGKVKKGNKQNRKKTQGVGNINAALEDDRFTDLFKNKDFNIDITNPRYKKTKFIEKVFKKKT